MLPKDTPKAPAPAAVAPSSGCGCTPPPASGSNGAQPSHVISVPLIYALGHLGYDFGTEPNRDWFAQQLDHPDAPEAMSKFLGKSVEPKKSDHPASAANLIWTLNQENTAIYAIKPGGPFATETYGLLRSFLAQQVDEGVELVSIPGLLTGSQITLMNGQTVPVMMPDARGMFSWQTDALIEHALGAEATEEHRSGLANFLRRVYYSLRNMGATSSQRAINYAATNAFQIVYVFGDAMSRHLELDAISAEPSPICRPGSDCVDVKITFFDPENLMRARRVYRFTVDVSDIIPVAVGEVRTWSER